MSKKPSRPSYIAPDANVEARPYRWCGYVSFFVGLACTWWTINTLFVEQRGGSGEAYLSVWSTAIAWFLFYRCSKRAGEIDPEYR